MYIGKMSKRGYKLQNAMHLEFSRVSVSGLISKFFNKKSILIILLFAVLLFNLAIATAGHPTLVGLQGKVQDSSGNDVASANLTVNISTSNSCTAGVFFSHGYPNNVSSGIFDIMLGSTYQLNLSYNEDYYLCLFVNGEQVGGPYRFRGGQGQIGSEDINKTDDYTFGSVNVTGTVNITNNITVGDSIIPDANNTGSIGSSLLQWATGFFNVIYEAGSLLSDLYCKLTGCTISGDLNVTGNVNVSGDTDLSKLYLPQLNGYIYFGHQSGGEDMYIRPVSNILVIDCYNEISFRIDENEEMYLDKNTLTLINPINMNNQEFRNPGAIKSDNDLKFYPSGDSDYSEIGQGDTNTNITYIALRNANGTLVYIYPNSTGDGIIASTTKP